MRIAVVGKGGAGKTSISGTMARVLSRRGHRVLAIDGDPNPTLAFTLGVAPGRVAEMPTVADDLVEPTEDGFRLTRTLAEVRAARALEAPDGVALLAMAPQREAGKG